MSKNDDKKAPEFNDESQELEFDYEDELVEETGLNDKLKKLRKELKESKKQSQEYLTGWQKERATFANYKAEEERKRQERIVTLKNNLVADFFPTLDSFDMAFSNKEAWEKVDSNWRTGVEYIYTQFMNVLQQYGISVIDEANVPFDPLIHDPVETISVDTKEQDGTILTIVQKGYQTQETVIRPAKVRVGSYES